MTNEGMTAAFPAIALTPAQARLLLHAADAEAADAALVSARRVIAARDATIAVLRLDSPAARAARARGALSAFLWPSPVSEGLDPALIDRLAASGLFLAGWYRDRYGEETVGSDAWAHYLAAGIAAGLAPNPFFDPDWYADTHLGGRRDEAAILHYLRVGARYALAPGPLFDPTTYLNADFAIAAEPDALAHFLQRGIDEGRVATPVAI